MNPVMFLPALPWVMGVLQEDIRPDFLRRGDRLPAARMFEIPCPMFLRDVGRRTVRAGYHLCGCTAFSSPEEQEAGHRLPRGEPRAYACGKTSSTKPLNDGVPGSGINGRQEDFGNTKRLTFVATTFQNATISRRP